jgi:hypothetical protein
VIARNLYPGVVDAFSNGNASDEARLATIERNTLCRGGFATAEEVSYLVDKLRSAQERARTCTCEEEE